MGRWPIHALVYFNNGSHQLTPRIEQALIDCGIPIRLYGLDRSHRRANVELCRFGNESFLADLASARAVVCTAGNQLIGEALHFQKPMLVLPEPTVEQRLNARAIQSMGIGEVASFRQLSAVRIVDFMARVDGYAARLAEYRVDGRSEAISTLDSWFEELRTEQQQRMQRRRLVESTT